MKKLYAYEGFEVSVRLLPGNKASRGTILAAAQGFIAVVQIRVVGATRPMTAPIRLTANDWHPFAIEAEALMAGFSAGKPLVDDTFSLFIPAGT